MEKYDKVRHSKIKNSGQGSLLMDQDIGYGHAITIHKSQGLSIDNVYFNANSLNAENDIPILDENGNKVTTEKQSLAYVAMSRAKNKLNVYEGTTPFTEIDNGDTSFTQTQNC